MGTMKPTRFFVAIPIVVFSLFLHGFASAATNSAGNPVSIVSVSNTAVNRIDSTFAGFSYEKSILGSPLFSAQNTALVNLFKLLGPGILRVGGNSVNNEHSSSTWTPDGRGLVMGQVAPADIDRLAGFLHATGWRVIYGLYGCGGYNGDGRTELSVADAVALSTNEAVYVAAKLGDSLVDFEIGNEPDLYGSRNANLEPLGFSESAFESLWEKYETSIKSAVPTAVFSGPATAGRVREFALPFADSVGNRLDMLTQHYYVSNGKSDPPPTIEDLLKSLSPNTQAHDRLIKELMALQQAADRRTRGKWRMAESNSFFNGGAPGVSDNAGSALWALEYCFTLAEYGALGVNFHGGGSSAGYTPIANNKRGEVLEARSEYYGIYLFSQVAHGSLLKVTAKGPPLFHAYAVSEKDGSLSVVVANNDSDQSVDANVRLPGTFTQASAVLLTAPSLTSISGMTIGGATVTPRGELSGELKEIPSKLDSSGRSIVVTVPHGSAMWIRLD